MVAVVTAGAVVMVQTPTLPTRLDFTPVSPQAAARLISASTVQVLAFGCNLERREGSAVAIAPDRILTNTHVVGGSRMVDVVADNRPTTVSADATVAKAGDVASLVDIGLDLPGLPLARQDAAAGSEVRLAGYPSAPDGVRAPGLVIDDEHVVGYVSGAAVGEPWPVMRLSGGALPGMSGGPILDAAGRLAGIVFGNELPSGNALAVPASALRRLIASGSFIPSTC